MTSPLRVLLTALALCLCLTLAAQQTKTRTKTEAGKTKAKTNNAKARSDTMATMTTPITPTTPEGTGGGIGEMAAPYTAAYSSQFTIGDPQHANMILALWKDWDDNKLDRNAAMLADTIVMEAPNGTMVRGKDSFLLSGKQYRGMYTSVKSTVEAYMPLRSTDRAENWVAIWGVEQGTGTDGTVINNRVHEIWRINRDGKIDYVRQFTAKPPTQ